MFLYCCRTVKIPPHHRQQSSPFRLAKWSYCTIGRSENVKLQRRSRLHYRTASIVTWISDTCVLAVAGKPTPATQRTTETAKLGKWSMCINKVYISLFQKYASIFFFIYSYNHFLFVLASVTLYTLSGPFISSPTCHR